MNDQDQDLPQRAQWWGCSIVYSSRFLKTFIGLHQNEQKAVARVIKNLAEAGREGTMRSQDHKKYGARPSCPKGAMIGRVNKEIRYIWKFEEDEARRLVIYDVLRHADAYRSEK